MKILPKTLNCTARRRGFTLIELLTVIAIVAILAGILIPAVARVRERANAATSVSNLRQMGQGVNLFLGDRSLQATMIGKGRYPAKWGTYGAEGFWSGYNWQDLIAEKLELAQLVQGGYEWLIAPHESIFQDPSNEVLFDPVNGNYNTTSSYAYNYQLGGTHAPHPFNAVEDTDKLPATVYKIENPARYVVIAESNRDGAWEAYIWPSEGWQAPGVPQHYDGGGHYLFADGHVEWMAYEEVMDNPAKYFSMSGKRF